MNPKKDEGREAQYLQNAEGFVRPCRRLYQQSISISISIGREKACNMKA